jgi:hypothetical protein
MAAFVVPGLASIGNRQRVGGPYRSTSRIVSHSPLYEGRIQWRQDTG